jgi:hypothetical protein
MVEQWFSRDFFVANRLVHNLHFQENDSGDACLLRDGEGVRDLTDLPTARFIVTVATLAETGLAFFLWSFRLLLFAEGRTPVMDNISML